MTYGTSNRSLGLVSCRLNRNPDTKRGEQIMNSIRMNTRLGLMVCLLLVSCFLQAAYAQQPTTATSVEQEFLDAIRKGNAQKVGALLKQQPTLIKASITTGTTSI